MKRKLHLGKHPVLLVWIFLFILLCVIVYAIPSLTGALRSTYTVKYGSLKVEDSGTGYLVRNERVYRAESGGTVNRYISDGSLVRKGVRVLEVNGSSSGEHSEQFKELMHRLNGRGVFSTYKTKDEGVVSYSADGYEYRLTPDNMADKSKSWYESLTNDYVVSLKRSKVKKNEPVFKVADRSKWYIVMFVDSSHAKRYTAGEQLKIRIDKRKSIYGDVQSVKKTGGSVRLIISTDYYYDRFASERTAQVTVTMSETDGLIIPNESIVKKKGTKGVYVRQKAGKYEFTPINVLATDGTQSAVSQSSFVDKNGKLVDTVENYDTILRHGK
ncbi:MAG: hypothetical protein LKG42_07920 [Eubacterium sp.]|jgi:putative membrane fusion protein|nr:hypothetical protein [Eubacterium sp.]MCH4046405.1 hypothetical protein [Eubacterium sp.]MCH4079500.1 hypothetical protein [Eubacterium sp.]MCH4111082.1 hypothetical protein [Eubacterium sp.]MCI1307929.1 hypothetical protein [Eubacterium sp.]